MDRADQSGSNSSACTRPRPGNTTKQTYKKISFLLLQGRTGSHTKSEIFNHNISDQPRILKSEIFNLKYFTSHQTYSIQLKQCTSPDNPPSFPHVNQWASERLVLTYAYLLTGTQRVKRYIPHPPDAYDRSPNDLRQHCLQKLGIHVYPQHA